MQQVTCNRQIRGDQAVSLGLIEGFLREFDNISAEWLLRGKGSMIAAEQPGLAKTQDAPVVSPLQDKTDLREDSIWKAKYEAIKECYDTLVAGLGGVMGKRNVG